MNEAETQTERHKSREWTLSEIETVRANADLGAEVISQLLDRSENSIRQLAKRQRISLRQRGERRGLVLGQPAGTRWIDQDGVDKARLLAIRSDVLDGSTDLSQLESRVREIALGSQKPTCPSCGVRPQDRAATGLCEVCHLRALAQAHRDDQATREAKRELWRARQESSRSRRAKANGDR